MGNSANGITKIFAGEIDSGTVNTTQLCVSDSQGKTCISRAQLDQFLQSQQSSPITVPTPPVVTPPVVTPPITPDPTTSPVVTPPDPTPPVPTPDPTPSPDPTPAPVVPPDPGTTTQSN